MSGSKLLAFRKRDDDTPLQRHFAIESDARLARFTGTGSMFGLAFAAWALTTPADLIPSRLVPAGTEYIDIMRLQPDTSRILVKPPPDYHRRLHPHEVARHHDKSGKSGRLAAAPKAAHPAGKAGWLGQNLVTSRNGRNDLGAYDMIQSVRHMDFDKITDLPVLKRTPHSGIGGRRGMESHEFNLEYNEDGEGGGGGNPDDPALPRWERPGKPATPDVKLPPPPRISSFQYAQESNARSSASILAVILSHSPGLRYVYNAYLKKQPGLAGKIQLRFSIAPGGDILELEIASSTTAAPDFDAAIAARVKSWRFDAVRAVGNDHVTVPFTFSE